MKLSFLVVALMAPFATFQAYADDSIPQSRQLSDLVVKGQRTYTRHTPDGLTITMKGNPAARLGMAYDALQQMPLIDGSTGRLEVAGKGSPEIYVNNRLVRDEAELKRLPTTDIKDIQIITHPDARYGADVRAVIRIRTKRRLEGLSGTFYANAGQSEKTSGKTSANLAYTFKNGLGLFGGADFDDAGFRQKRQYHEGFNAGRFHTDTYGINSNRTRQLTANAGLVYDFKDNSVGVRYEFRRALPSDYLARNTERTNASAFSAITSVYNNREDAYNHHVNTYFVVKPWAKATLTADGDYITNGKASLGHLAEQAGREAVAAVATHNQGHYHVAAGKINLETALIGGTLDAGGQYTYTLNRQAFNKEATGETPDLPRGTNEETQHLTAFYLSYQHALGRYWNWKAGLRYELADFTYYLNGRKMAGQSELFRDWLPHAQVNYNRNGLSLGLSYTATVSRPGYALLGSDYTYVSHTLWETGNPLLRSSKNHDITLDVSWKGWMLSLDYYRNERAFQPVYTYDADRRINVTFYQNMPFYNGFSATLYKEFAFSFWHPAVQALLLLQGLKYGTPSQTYNKPMAQLALNNRFDLPAGIFLYLNGFWLTKGHTGLSEWGGAAMLNLTLSKSFGEQWSLNFTASDFVNSWRQKNTIHTNGVFYSYLIKGASRTVSLSLTYRFHKATHTYRGKSAAGEELKRLQ